MNGANHRFLLLLLPLLLLTIGVQSSSSPHFTISLTENSGNDPIYNPPKEYFQVTLPLPTDHATPACSVTVLTYTFGGSDAPTSPPIAPPTSPPSFPPTSPPSISPATSPPTSSPPSISPATSPSPATAPPPSSPPTSAPSPTSEPPAIAPPTSEPPTIAPPTSEPPTIAPPTSEPPTIAPATSEPPTIAPPTSEPPTIAPATSEPPTIAPPTSEPPAIAPPTSEPPSIAPTSESPAIAPPTSEPPSIAPPTSEPPAIAPPTSEPPAIAPPTSEPPAIAPPTSEPPAIAPPTSEPPTINPPTSEPPAIAPTSEPPTIAPPTSEPPAISPPTSAPPTGAPPTSSPPTISPTASSPPTSIAPTSCPLTSSASMNSRLIGDGCDCGNTSVSPSITVVYTPPPVTCVWSHAVLEYQVEYKGEHFDSIAGVWIDGVELLRTSTAQATEEGCLWSVRKDVTRYSSILTQENLTLSVILQNLGNIEFTGIYQVNVSFLFYSDNALKLPSSLVSGETEALRLNRKLIGVTSENADTLALEQAIQSLYPYDKPADMIVPISGSLDEGYWFKIQNELDMRTTQVQISPTTYKVVLELCVSFHGDDEFWYMNPPDSYLQANRLTSGHGHGAYREVLVTIDGKLVGTVIPFPVIFPNGINPLFWSPVVSMGAFDVPSYDIDLTPYLGLLSDNQNHSLGIQIADGIPFWLVDANLHLWSGESTVQAIVKFKEPSMEIETEYEFEGLDGEFETEVERSSKGTGWVQSSAGLVKTKISQEINFKNKLKFKNNGMTKTLEQKIKTKTKIKITNQKGDATAKIEIEKLYPLTITMKSEAVFGEDVSKTSTIVLQERTEKYNDKKGRIKTVLNQKQNCTGSMLVKGSSVIEGFAENHQTYNYQDELGCHSRKVDVVGGDVVGDDIAMVCPHT